jgi:4-amino-4-deoxy-L-arabinose transferase-like glycosyltransferase
MNNDKKSETIIFAAVVAVSIFTAFWSLDERAVGNHEAYVGVVARNMVEKGNWFMPYFNGEPRLQKTPLNYWLVAASTKAAGKMNEFVVRLPSAALAVLSAIAIFYFVYDWLDVRVAAFASLIWSTSLCYIRYSHTGRPEMALAAFITIAMLSFYSAVKERSGRKQIWYVFVFWTSFGLAMLAKGPAPLPLVLPALFLYLAVFRYWHLTAKLLPIWGLILFFVIVFSWPVYVLIRQAGAIEIWKNEFLARAVGEYAAGSKPIYYYLKVMFVYFLPFSAFLPFALAAPLYQIWERKRELMFYLWLWFTAGIVVMSICGGKRQHYILPVMPAMAILAGIIIDDMVFANKAYSRRFSKFFLIGHIAVGVLGIIGLIIWMHKTQQLMRDFITYTGAIVIVLLVFAGVFFLLGKKTAAMAGLFIALCTAICIWPVLDNKLNDENYIIRDFANRVSSTMTNGLVVAYCKVEPAFIYYFGQDVPIVSDINEIYIMYNGGCGIIASGDNLEQLKKNERMRLFKVGLNYEQGLFLKNEEGIIR